GCLDANNCSYDSEAAFDNGSCGSGQYTCSDGTSGCGCDDVCGDTLEPPAVLDCFDNCGGGAVLLCNSVESGGGENCVQDGVACYDWMYNNGDCDEVNAWIDCSDVICGQDDPIFYETGCADEGYIACDGGRCYTCEDGGTDYQTCVDAGLIWTVETNADGTDVVTNQDDCPSFVAEGDPDDGWVPFVDYWNTDEEETGGDHDQCYCTAEVAASYCEVSCPALGDLNGDSAYNVLDIVALANCVLANNCDTLENGCAGDMNGDGAYNVLDIVNLANCVLANNCGGRV
ncbi:uncharacterized protein METZ01_LOCUS397285, partial [marine metagenome]